MWQNIYNPNTGRNEYTHNGTTSSGGTNPSQTMWGYSQNTLSW